MNANLRASGAAGVGWIAAGVFLIFSIALGVKSHSVAAAAIALPLVGLTAPPARQWLLRKTGISLSVGPLALVCFVLVAIQASLASMRVEERQAAEDAAREAASRSRVAKGRDDALQHFETNKEAVLGDIAAKEKQGDLAGALALVNRYQAVSNDPDLANARRSVELAQARAELPNAASMPTARQAALFKTLADAEPGNAAYRQKAEQLAAVVAQEKTATELAARAAARREVVEQQFSKWDGSHPNVVDAVKKTMRNPPSFEHVKTSYRDNGRTILVEMIYRGTNGFGGVVTDSAMAEVDEHGNVLGLVAKP